MTWQKCPICNGSGFSVNIALSTSLPLCEVCKGRKIISTETGRPPERRAARGAI